MRPDRPRSAAFPIVGVGASAGGLEALTQLLRGMPADTGMAFVVVQHLAPKHDSILASLLARVTTMPVLEAAEGLKVLPNHVYVIPPRQDLLLRDGHLGLALRPEPHAGPHMPIDLFLRTLAETHDHLTVGVILSGTGSDGTLGLRAIKDAGGVGIAQDPETAGYESMPRSAIANGSVDFVLAPAKIGAELARLARSPHPPPPEKAAAPDGGDVLGQILGLVRQGTGTDFSSYKKTTLLRRIRRRMLIGQIESLSEYGERLAADSAEVAALHRDLLINVTSFFRDPESFAFIATEILPKLLAHHAADAPLRVWVPGCSTGEEAYSIAMCLLECADTAGRSPLFQIFGTDISEKAIEGARAGIYLENIAGDVSAERLARFFVKLDGQYQVTKMVRDLCIFARHDVSRDPPFSRLDFISCRNLLIYLEGNLQQRVFAAFHYALAPGRYLMLGGSETVGAAAEYFSIVDHDHRVYAKLPVASPMLAGYRRQRAEWDIANRSPVAANPAALLPPPPLQRAAQRLLMSRYGPASVLVNAALEALELRGDTDAYLQHAAGDASLNLMRIIREDLTADLRQALSDARASGRPSRREGLRIRRDGKVRSLDLEVAPVKAPGSEEAGFLVIFDQATGRKAARSKPGQPPASATEADTRSELERELELTREHLRATIESQDAINEELQSANEEILSSNEELQSINEELETAKEELQSGNEELTTLNEELHHRNQALGRLNDDLANVLDSVGMPIVVLDGDLALRRFTPTAGRLLNLIASDVGRPFDNIRSNLEQPDFTALIHQAMQTGETVEREVAGRDGSGYSLRVHPYRTRDNRIDGAVLTFVDVTEAKRHREELQAALDMASAATERAEDMGRLKEQFVATVSHELRGPLNIMAGWTHLLRAGADEKSQHKALEGIDKAIASQTRLVADLLDFSSIESGRLRLALAPAALLPIVEAAMAGARASAEAKGLRFGLADGASEAVVLADVDRLQQMVWNLISNAIKFTPRGGLVQVWTGRVDTHIEIRVRDSGRGIAPDELPHIFYRFRRAAAARAEDSGLGLGLSIVRQLAELHGGQARAQSDGPGSGSEFVLVLPVPPVDAVPESDTAAAAAGAPIAAAAPLAGLRILLVEDDAPSRDVLRKVLAASGAIVTATASAAAGFANLERSVPHVVVSDIGMEPEDGYSLIRRVRQLPADRGGLVAALALTGFAGERPRKLALAAGFDAYVEKPADPTALVSAVARLAALRAAE